MGLPRDKLLRYRPCLPTLRLIGKRLLNLLFCKQDIWVTVSVSWSIVVCYLALLFSCFSLVCLCFFSCLSRVRYRSTFICYDLSHVCHMIITCYVSPSSVQFWYLRICHECSLMFIFFDNLIDKVSCLNCQVLRLPYAFPVVVHSIS
jgi:hypothetical protein